MDAVKRRWRLRGRKIEDPFRKSGILYAHILSCLSLNKGTKVILN